MGVLWERRNKEKHICFAKSVRLNTVLCAVKAQRGKCRRLDPVEPGLDRQSTTKTKSHIRWQQRLVGGRQMKQTRGEKQVFVLTCFQGCWRKTERGGSPSWLDAFEWTLAASVMTETTRWTDDLYWPRIGRAASVYRRHEKPKADVNRIFGISLECNSPISVGPNVYLQRWSFFLCFLFSNDIFHTNIWVGKSQTQHV